LTPEAAKQPTAAATAATTAKTATTASSDHRCGQGHAITAQTGVQQSSKLIYYTGTGTLFSNSAL
jgi:hypothetical protein